MRNNQEIVYHHNCKVLGPDTRVPRSLLSDPKNKYILCHQHKCPFCNETAGEKELGIGVKIASDGGYIVDTTIAEKLV